MKINIIKVGPFEVNCYIIEGTDNNAIVIDPGDDASTIAGLLNKKRIKPAIYLLTHGHMDHVSALAELNSLFPAPTAIHPLDLKWAFTSQNEYLPYYPTPKAPTNPTRPLEDNQTWTDAGLTYKVITSPGHTPGCVCFLFEKENIMFTGDTLFAGSVGRTDIIGGDSKILQESIAKLSKLDDQITVYPGHGPASEIGTEKKTNYFMRSHAF